MSSRLLILGWHAVDPTPAFPGSTRERREGFARQLRWLRRWTSVTSLPDAVENLLAGRALPPLSVALTFDDGYRDMLDVVVPALAASDLPATFFLVPDLMTEDTTPWWEVLAASFTDATVAHLDWAGRRFDLSDERRRRRVQDGLLPELKRLSHVDRVEAVHELRRRLLPCEPAPEACSSGGTGPGR